MPHQEEYLQKPKFVAKMIVVLVIFLNGLFLNIFIGPNLEKVSFNLPHAHRPNELHRYSRMAFVSGSISLVSWLTAFILGSIKSTSLSLREILIIYFFLLLSAVTGSLIIEKLLDLKYRKIKNR